MATGGSDRRKKFPALCFRVGVRDHRSAPMSAKSCLLRCQGDEKRCRGRPTYTQVVWRRAGVFPHIFAMQTFQGRGSVTLSSQVAIVDDDESIRDALEELLKSLGYGVRSFASADEFLDHARPTQYDCIILDVQMPGMTGLELQARLVQAGVSIPIIFVTSFGDTGVKRRALRAGAHCVLEKPVQETTILGCLETALAGDAPPF